MKTPFLLISLFIFAVLSSCTDAVEQKVEDPSFPEIVFPLSNEFDLKVQNFASFNLNGFHVLLNYEVIERDTEISNLALQALYNDLLRINGFNLKQRVIDELKEVPIFINWDRDVGVYYHVALPFLRGDENFPEDVKGIELANVNNFLDWREQNQPFIVLHEFAHAYHDRVIGFNTQSIVDIHFAVESSGLYRDVSYHNGNGNFSTVSQAYAINNHIEYFAELTEAYFGVNDYFPFRKIELAEYDTSGYNMIEQAWQIDQ